MDFLTITISLAVVLVLAFITFYQWSFITEWLGNRQIRSAIKFLDESDDYLLLRDVVFLTFEGLIHISFIVVSRFGVFVVGKYDFRGVIDGDEHENVWTQFSSSNKQCQFDNPAIRIKISAQILVKLLGVPKEKVFPLVVFDSIS